MRRCVRIWSMTDDCVMTAPRRITPWPVGHASGSTSKRCWSRAAHRRTASVGASRGGPVVRQPLHGDRMPRAVAREAGRDRAIVLRDPDGGVHVEPGVRPRQHPGGLILVEAVEAHEHAEHGAAERLRQPGGIVRGPRHTKVPSGRKPPSVTRRCAWGCQLAREPCVCQHAMIPTARSRSPVSVRMAAVTMRAATRAISPSRRRRYRQDARRRFGIVSTARGATS